MDQVDQQLLIIAVFTGAVVAGAVWILWSLVENLAHTFRGRKPSAHEEMSSGEGI